MRTTIILLVGLVLGLLAATPARAARNRLTALIDLTWTPDAAHHPFGVGLGLEGALAMTQPARAITAQPVDGNAGLGLRVRLHGDGGLDVAVEPILGVIAGAPDLLCGGAFPFYAALDVRPGLILRSRGGPGLSLGGAATGVYRFYPLRLHVSAVRPFRRDASRPARVPGSWQDPVLAVGTGVSFQTIGCNE